MISTSERVAEHPFAGPNTLQVGYLMFVRYLDSQFILRNVEYKEFEHKVKYTKKNNLPNLFFFQNLTKEKEQAMISLQGMAEKGLGLN